MASASSAFGWTDFASFETDSGLRELTNGSRAGLSHFPVAPSSHGLTKNFTRRLKSNGRVNRLAKSASRFVGAPNTYDAPNTFSKPAIEEPATSSEATGT